MTPIRSSTIDATRLPFSGSVLCRECDRPLVADPVSRAPQCPAHGLLVAQIVHHAEWESEIVEVLHPSQSERARYVVRFPSREHRTVWFEDLRVVAMHHPGANKA